MSASTHPASLEAPAREAQRPLEGARIRLVFEHSLSHYTRILQEIEALREAGAMVQLLTCHEPTDGPPAGLDVTTAPLPAFSPLPNRVSPSDLSWRPLRIADNLARRVARSFLGRRDARSMTRARRRAIARIAEEADLFWVVDYPSLPDVMRVAPRRGVSVVYETVDLVPEYRYAGERHRRAQLAGERRLIGRVDGFVTACDSYADYYMERYGGRELTRRPVVRDNMPDRIASAIRPTSSPLRLLFLGSLMFDRPVTELIDAVSASTADVTLTFQGKNYLGDEPMQRIAELGVGGRVAVVGPCAPEEIVETASAYDIGVVALRGDDENERRASTSKVFTYMAAGLAILGSDLPGIARIVDEYRNGALVTGIDPGAWASAIDHLAALRPEDIDTMKQHSLDAAHRHSWERQKPAFVAEFARALAARREDRS